MPDSVVAVVMGSDSDLPVMRSALETLTEFGISYTVDVISAHRSPAKAHDFATQAEGNGLKVIIAGAGGAAHLAGVIASLTTLPVIGIPMPTDRAGGLDSLFSTVQMPKGVPVATVGIGKSGAQNAALLAAQILALSDPDLKQKLQEKKADLACQVDAAAAKMNEELAKDGLSSA